MKPESAPYYYPTRVEYIRQFITEFLGTALLATVVVSGIPYGASYGALGPALVVGLLVYLVGSVSGTHLNPAITLSLWMYRRIPTTQALLYIVAQLAGALLGGVGVSRLLLGYDVALAGGNLEWSWAFFAAELVGTAILSFAVNQTVRGRVPETASGLVIGTGLFIGASLAQLQGGGALNPAVAISTLYVTPQAIIAPILGALLGAFVAQMARPVPEPTAQP